MSILGFVEIYCKTVSKFSTSFHSGSDQVNVTKFFVPEEAIPTSFENHEIAKQFVRDTGDDLVGSYHSDLTGRYCDKSGGGFVNTRCQTLHEAEINYRETTLFASEDPDSASTWDKRNMTNLTGYNNGNPSNYDKAWKVKNAQVKDDDILSNPGDGKVQQQKVFPGGFAGKCNSTQIWRYDRDNDRWQCDGELPWNFNFTVPDIDTKGEPDGTVGVFFDDRIFRNPVDTDPYVERRQSLKYSWRNIKPSTINLDYLRVRCYAGTGGFTSVSTNSRFPDFGWDAVSIPAGGFGQSLVGVTGDIRIGDRSKYTCEWEINATKSTGGNVVFDDAGIPSEIKPSYLIDYGVVNGMNLTELCPSDYNLDTGTDDAICPQDSIRASTDVSSGYEMENLSAAVKVN